MRGMVSRVLGLHDCAVWEGVVSAMVRTLHQDIPAIRSGVGGRTGILGSYRPVVDVEFSKVRDYVLILILSAQ